MPGIWLPEEQEVINHDVALDINEERDTTEEWLKSVSHRADMSMEREPPAHPTIFRVPLSLRCCNQRDYEPKLISIGPYHHKKSDDLMAMDELKWRMLHHYFSMVLDGSNNEGLRKIKDFEKEAQSCYSEAINLSSYEFMEMLLLDGCFLVQIFIMYDDSKTLQARELESLLFKNTWFGGLIFRDLLLLENQLPYFIVKHLLDTLSMPKWNSFRLEKAAISSFIDFLPGHLNISQHRQLEQELQVLPLSDNPWPSEKFLRTVPTATELVEAGVQIKVRKANIFLDISFCKDTGELGIPAIDIHDYVNFFFVNHNAFEQCCRQHGSRVTHYTAFMDHIINTSKDVQLLYRKGIISRSFGDDENIASLFNKLGKGVIMPDSEKNYLKLVYQDLNTYCQSRSNRWRAKLMHDYFSNPWAFISLAAAALLIVLATLQTFYTVLGYYFGK